jgi:hypothetical protein
MFLGLIARSSSPPPPPLALTGADTLKLHVSSTLVWIKPTPRWLVMHPAGLVKTLGVRLVLDLSAADLEGEHFGTDGTPRLRYT